MFQNFVFFVSSIASMVSHSLCPSYFVNDFLISSAFNWALRALLFLVLTPQNHWHQFISNKTQKALGNQVIPDMEKTKAGVVHIK